MAASRHRGEQEVKEEKEVGRMNKYNEVANDARAKLKIPRGLFFQGRGVAKLLVPGNPADVAQRPKKGLVLGEDVRVN